ncbi:MAG: NBR1-Ig-like domain-containing protein, partial [Anaerolineales bacterium]
TDVPSPTARLTQTPSTPLPSPNSTSTPGGVIQTATLAAFCDQAAAGNPIDITIPDDSLIQAGESFIKTWKLVNIGTCTWTTYYSASFFYGDRMGAPVSVPLQATVLPAQSVEVSVEMLAPLSPGTYQGNWKLSNPGGVLFGIGPNGDSPFWVRIIVAENQSGTATATEGVTATLSPTDLVTSTPTPEGQVSGKLSPVPGDTIDLDNLTLNGDNEDFAYQVDANQFHWLYPHEEAMIGVYGNQKPSLADCQSAGMSSAPIAVESLSIGTYLCYTTNERRLGRALLEAVDTDDFTLTLDLLTWLWLP